MTYAPRLAALLMSSLVLASASGAPAHDVASDRADNATTTITTARSYPVPGVHLIRDDGKEVSLVDELDDGRPVVLNFIFTTCSSVCPLMSQTFSQFEHKLGEERTHVHLMSISIDPEQDTPARLREYARKFHAGPEWQHYTGTLEASLAAQRAFNVWRGSKMGHAPITLLRAAPGQPWLRIDGLVTPAELLEQYRKLVPPTLQAVTMR